ncbi:MAG: tRNA lysidine(34) synthetase TilS [Bacteroidales bacterium]|nr:tRNA lysidine(34) synthetase TilS [Bacteroidales bacterium]
MESLIINTVKRLFPEEGRALLAVSGGIDSMCMATSARQAGLRFSVAHCNFHLRGEESDADASLVRSWCESEGAECFVRDFDTEAYASAHGVSIEMAARELRYSWFAELCSSEGFDAVFVAHNANDNAETLILNLLRGTGIKGVCGMAERSEQIIHGYRLAIIRPMLSVSRAAIADYAKANSVPFHEDRTNADVAYKRNRVRHQILPAMEAINSSALKTLAADMENFREVSELADSYYQDFLSQVVTDGESVRIPLKVLQGIRSRKYLLYRLMEPYDFTRSDVSGLSVLIDSPVSGKQFRNGGAVAYLTSSELVIEPAAEEWSPVSVSGPGRWNCGGAVVEVSLASAPKNPASEGGILLDAAKISFPFVVRPWREGDWMCPLGMRGRRRKLSDIFVSLKVASAQKPSVPLIEYPGTEGRIAGIIGYGKIDDSLKVCADTQLVIKIYEAGSKD